MTVRYILRRFQRASRGQSHILLCSRGNQVPVSESSLFSLHLRLPVWEKTVHKGSVLLGWWVQKHTQDAAQKHAHSQTKPLFQTWALNYKQTGYFSRPFSALLRPHWIINPASGHTYAVCPWQHADTNPAYENTQTQVKDFSSLGPVCLPPLRHLPLSLFFLLVLLYLSPSSALLSPWQHWHHGEVDTPTVVVLIQRWVTDTHLRTSLWKLHLRTAIGENTKWIGACLCRAAVMHICGSEDRTPRDQYSV